MPTDDHRKNEKNLLWCGVFVAMAFDEVSLFRILNRKCKNSPIITNK